MKTTLVVTFTAEAAHRLTGLPENHRCSRPHGHHYTIRYYIRPVAWELTNGMVMEADVVRNILQPVIAKIDHHDLNSLDDSIAETQIVRDQPTAENLAQWLWVRTKGLINNGGRHVLEKITVQETDRLTVEVTA